MFWNLELIQNHDKHSSLAHPELMVTFGLNTDDRIWNNISDGKQIAFFTGRKDTQAQEGRCQPLLPGLFVEKAIDPES